jgi:hypothetical protein
MPTSTHTETAAAFAAEWEQWHAAHERRRADPRGRNRPPVAIEAGEQIPHERQAGQ